MNSELSSYCVQPQPVILKAMPVNKTHSCMHSCTRACFDGMGEEVSLPLQKENFHLELKFCYFAKAANLLILNPAYD